MLPTAAFLSRAAIHHRFLAIEIDRQLANQPRPRRARRPRVAPVAAGRRLVPMRPAPAALPAA